MTLFIIICSLILAGVCAVILLGIALVEHEQSNHKYHFSSATMIVMSLFWIFLTVGIYNLTKGVI